MHVSVPSDRSPARCPGSSLGVGLEASQSHQRGSDGLLTPAPGSGANRPAATWRPMTIRNRDLCANAAINDPLGKVSSRLSTLLSRPRASALKTAGLKNWRGVKFLSWINCGPQWAGITVCCETVVFSGDVADVEVEVLVHGFEGGLPSSLLTEAPLMIGCEQWIGLASVASLLALSDE
jgi:hypothetical protein